MKDTSSKLGNCKSTEWGEKNIFKGDLEGIEYSWWDFMMIHFGLITLLPIQTECGRD